MRTFGLGLACLALCGTAGADEEAENHRVMVESTNRLCYARSIPERSYGSEGRTEVFLRGVESDQLVRSYEWYARKLFIDCSATDTHIEPTLIRTAMWWSGSRASSSDIAIEFFAGGELVAAHSTQEIAVDAQNVAGSVSHYFVFSGEFGFEESPSGKSVFIAQLVDGSRVEFDSHSGDILSRGAGN